MSFTGLHAAGIAAQPSCDGPRHLAPRPHRRLTRGGLATVPIVLVSSIAISLNLVTPAQAAQPVKRVDKVKSGTAEALGTLRATVRPQSHTAPARTAVTTAAAPRTYTVVNGDTVTAIASRFGLSTAGVLALNGLSWKSLIFAGQTLVLTETAAAPAPAPVASSIAKYTVVSGDTISHIAAAHGLSVQAVLSANGLSRSSLIFPGQSITLPTATAAAAIVPVSARVAAPVPAPVPAPAPVAPAGITPLTAEMRGNAAIIVSVGRRIGVGDYGLIIALAAAMQESGLRNLDHGDRDSLGLFQQRSSTGWGTPAQIMDPVQASLAFFGGPGNPNAGRTRGLLDIPGWPSMTVTQAAQAVQISAYPNAYAAWEASARVWLTQLG
jgi:LysM repeat protein